MSRPQTPNAALKVLQGLLMPAVARVDRLGFQWLEERLARHGLTLAEFRLVGALVGEPQGLSQRELARRLGVKPPTVSTLLPRLERAGVVVRRDDPEDSRAWRVCLKQNVAGMAEVLDLVRELDALAFKGLSSREKDVLLSALNKAANNLSQR